MKVLTSALGTTAARFLVRAGWSREDINSVLRGDNFIDKSTFQEMQADVDRLETLQEKFAAPNVLNLAKKPTAWKASGLEMEEATPERAALILRKGEWKPEDIQSALKMGDKHSSEIERLYHSDETLSSKGKQSQASTDSGSNPFGVFILIAIGVLLFLTLVGG